MLTTSTIRTERKLSTKSSLEMAGAEIGGVEIGSIAASASIAILLFYHQIAGTGITNLIEIKSLDGTRPGNLTRKR
jgi:hypothetical protein